MNPEEAKSVVEIQFDIEEKFESLIKSISIRQDLHFHLNLLVKMAKQEVLNEITSKINAINGEINSIITKQI